MIRRLNYTRRQKLARGDVSVRVTPHADGRPRLAVSLALEKYRLPPDARVFVEAYRSTTFERFDFGTAASPAPTASTVLRQFGTAQGVRFRVRVVEPATAGRAPRILALVDDLRPVAPAAPQGGLSLLPVDWGDLEGHAWKLEIDDETGPLLRVSRTLVPERESFVGSREFVSLVLPAVLHRVLERALLAGADDDDAGWAADWLKLAASLPEAGPPPEHGTGERLSDEEEDWIDDAVEAFCKAHAIGDRFRAWWNAGPA
jgi:hypothetical protein